MISQWLGGAIALLAGLYLLVLITRMIRFFSPLWRPSGLILPIANLVYALTDPPLSFLRRIIPPLRLGGNVAIDLGFMILFLATIIVENLGVFVRSLGF
mgnify:CR=1 FL=1